MLNTTPWVSTQQDLLNSLSPGMVHIWRAPLDDSPERASLFRLYLSDDERTRADRCRTPHPQYQFIITRSILRILLSHYLGILPTHIQFNTQPHGKPMLEKPFSLPIQFNVSHTQGMALIALTLKHAIGIDVERIDRHIQDQDIAERYFSPQESAKLASLPPPERLHHFFSHWTCKEAYLKMRGEGITGGLAQHELTFDPQECKVRLSSLDPQRREEDCSLYQMTAGEEHVGAVSVACSSVQISYLNWQEKYFT